MVEAQEVEGETDSTLSQSRYQTLLRGERMGPAPGKNYEHPTAPTVYLTFDDGPGPLTTEVLDILAEYDVKATFFQLGQLAEKRPEVVRRVKEDGHALGNHSYDHDYDKLYQNVSSLWEQVEQSEQVFIRETGERTRLFRAPGGTYGKFDVFYYYFLEQAGYQVHDWNVDSGDSRRRGVPAAEIVANIASTPLQHEMTVLLHDGAGHEETVKALPAIIEYYQELGYTFKALDETVEPEQFRISDKAKAGVNSWEEFTRLEEGIAQATLDFEPYQYTIQVASLEAAEALSEISTDAVKEPKRSASMSTEPSHPSPSIGMRDFFEKRGGMVRWMKNTQTAVATYHGDRLEYVPARGMLRIFTIEGTMRRKELDGLRLEQGVLRMPTSHVTWLLAV